MKNILYIVSVFPSTSATFVLNEILELKKEGFNIEIASLRKSKGEIHQSGVESFNDILYIPHIRQGVYDTLNLIWSNIIYCLRYPKRYFRVFKYIKNKKSKRLWYDFFRSVYLDLQLEKLNINHVHSQFAHSPTNIAFLLNILSGRKYSYTCHAVDIFVPENRILLEEQLEKASFAITISNFNIKYIKNIIKNKSLVNKFEVVRCGIDYNKFKNEVNKNKYNKKINIFSVGRFVEKKGFIYLIEALRSIKEEDIDFECNIVGDGPLYKEIEEKIYNYNLEKEVKLVGSVGSSEIRNYLNNSDIFVLPCVQAKNGDMDGIPVSLMEAMAFEIPVISTQISGIPELIENGVSGLVVEPENSIQLKEAIIKLIKSQSLREEYGKNGRIKVINEYGLGDNTRILVDKFIETIN